MRTHLLWVCQGQIAKALLAPRKGHRAARWLSHGRWPKLLFPKWKNELAKGHSFRSEQAAEAEYLQVSTGSSRVRPGGNQRGRTRRRVGGMDLAAKQWLCNDGQSYPGTSWTYQRLSLTQFCVCVSDFLAAIASQSAPGTRKCLKHGLAPRWALEFAHSPTARNHETLGEQNIMKATPLGPVSLDIPFPLEARAKGTDPMRPYKSWISRIGEPAPLPRSLRSFGVYLDAKQGAQHKKPLHPTVAHNSMKVARKSPKVAISQGRQPIIHWK